MTPNELRTSRNRSGYRYVVPCGGGRGWQASRNGGGRPDGWRGPMRRTPLEAAQDYCAHHAGETIAHFVRPRHPSRRIDRDPEVEAALGMLRDARAQRRGEQGYVYCIGQRRHLGHLAVQVQPPAVKIGYSVNPEARVGELQTGNPNTLYLIGKVPGTVEDEAALHARYAHLHILGEWFRLTASLLSEFK